MEQAHKAIQVEREKFQASLTSFLPATQRAKMMLRMAGHMAGRMGEHKGFGPGGWGGHEQGMGHEEGFGPRGKGQDRGSKPGAPEQEDEE